MLTMQRKKETILHGLVTCHFIDKVWYASQFAIRINTDGMRNFQEWMKYWLTLTNVTNKERLWICERITITCWFIWKSKNAII